jgi:hypothetical protein
LDRKSHIYSADIAGQLFADNIKIKSPSLVPPTQVLLKPPVGHVALAARTQPSHLPLDTLRVAPLFTGVKVNLLVPLAPTVDAGFPPHFSIVPAIPPQIERMATFVSWVFRFRPGSVHVVPVTASGLTFVLAGDRATSRRLGGENVGEGLMSHTIGDESTKAVKSAVRAKNIRKMNMVGSVLVEIFRM